MTTDKLVDFLLKNYGERSQLPQDREQLCAIFYLAQHCKQQLKQENAELQRQNASLRAALKEKLEKNTKKTM
ncbi:MAG: hypothetical protein ACD_44C00227G0001 [uncultured bacterium]|nr:MAG: hypothetical protein ACD_44C00227G0001 [uncultured bacterium]